LVSRYLPPLSSFSIVVEEFLTTGYHRCEQHHSDVDGTSARSATRSNYR
jgi:hypothetical protein